MGLNLEHLEVDMTVKYPATLALEKVGNTGLDLDERSEPEVIRLAKFSRQVESQST